MLTPGQVSPKSFERWTPPLPQLVPNAVPGRSRPPAMPGISEDPIGRVAFVTKVRPQSRDFQNSP